MNHQAITRSCLRLLLRRRKLISPGVATLQGLLESGELIPNVGQTSGPYSPQLTPSNQVLVAHPAGLRSVGIAVRLAEGSKAQRGWLHTARVGSTRRPAAFEWSGSAEAIPAPLVMQRQGSSPRSSGLGRLCLSKPLTTGDRYSQRIGYVRILYSSREVKRSH